ncbi:MAG: hypothetical protein M1510_06095 [Nitrospirae bacterium]|nr:hypothetical protein [Nitrospirota bacterium]MCL5236264.1 hypothetical protein [Nitrospirota bacterium]
MSVKRQLSYLIAVFVLLCCVVPAESAEVIIIGDTQLKPVLDVVREMEKVLPSHARAYAPSQVHGNLRTVVNEESAKAVIALGKDAVDIAVNLPESIPVIYGMLIMPPKAHRQNMTGVYMETPIDEYLALINRSFPGMRRIGVIYSSDTEKFVKSVDSLQIKALKAKNSYEFVNAVNSLNVDALLLLPDKHLLSPTAVEAVYLFSFRKKIPVLGISEKHVKEGSLLALVFDTAGMGRQLAEMAKTVLSTGNAELVSPSSPQRFNLYINTDTARKMNINIPEEIIRKAKRIYP